MKKILLFCMMSLILFCSCNGCLKEEKIVVEQGTPMVVQNVISTDKEAMYLINKDYRWFETLILLNKNPQWVFGNIQSQIWVDAVTGDIKESNPAFPDGFKMPLGEWP